MNDDRRRIAVGGVLADSMQVAQFAMDRHSATKRSTLPGDLRAKRRDARC